MATQQWANVSITNNMGGNASILLFHTNSSNGTQRGSWTASAGATVGPLKVIFETGIGTGGIQDYWSVIVHVTDGLNAGHYISSGTAIDPYWKECQLQHEDDSQSLTFTVDTNTFNTALKSGGCTGGMTKIAPAAPITHVFCLMLENHSFDNIFAMSGIPGLTAATTANSNSYNGVPYSVQTSAPLSLQTDPGHEFFDVLCQLAQICLPDPLHPPTPPPYNGGPYPTVTNLGFAASYATSNTEKPNKPPPATQIDYIMSCFDTPNQLPVMNFLAHEFAICDHWFSSLPGPTWPNRFFLHGASSSGLDDSPSGAQSAKWEIPPFGFKYQNGSIYGSLTTAGIPWRIYHDASSTPPFHSLYSDNPQNGSVLGAVPIVAALSGVELADVHSMENFASDLQGPYPYGYTFIEPHYGDASGGTYAGGSSQHPMDDVYGGEHLVAAVYNAIRNSPYWNTSMLVITYDEHGGFYDSVLPPASPNPPGDTPPTNYTQHNFPFTQLGVRVPAVVVSPLIPQGTVDHTQYDHSSMLKALEENWNLPNLTQRDLHATSPNHLLTLTTPRDVPVVSPVPLPVMKSSKAAPTVAERAVTLSEPVPEKGNIVGSLAILKKTEMEMSLGTPPEMALIHARHAAVVTRGDAEAYSMDVLQKVRIRKEARKLARVTPGK